MPSWLQNAPNIRRTRGAHIAVGETYPQASTLRFGGGRYTLAEPDPGGLLTGKTGSLGAMTTTPTPELTIGDGRRAAP